VLKDKADANKNKSVKDLVMLLCEMSCLASGFTLEDLKVNASRIHRIIRLGLGIDEEDMAPVDYYKSDDLLPLQGDDENASDGRGVVGLFVVITGRPCCCDL